MTLAVLFDLDGVLVDTFDVWHAVMNDVAAGNVYPPISRRRFTAAWGQGVDADVATFFPRTSVEELEALYDATFPAHLEHLRVMPGATPLFATLRERGHPLAVITNTPSPLARELLRRAGLAPDALVGGTDVPRPKPAPDMVLRALELLAARPTDAVVVGDSAYDRDAATAAGVPFIGFRYDGGQARIEDLARLPDLLSATAR